MNEPVFPKKGFVGHKGIIRGSDGLTRRELFAALALMGIRAGQEWANHESQHLSSVAASCLAVRDADALIKALENINVDT